MNENQSLLEEIQNLTEQLRTSKKDMESYAEMANIERINKYKRTIEELKQQLKQQSQSKHFENAVPMNLYRSVVVEAKQYANQVQQQRMAIHTLENQILQLEQERRNKHPLQQQPTTTTNGTRSYQLSYPPMLNDYFPLLVPNDSLRSTSAARSSSTNMHGQNHPAVHTKQPRPKTPLPKKVVRKSSFNISPDAEVPSNYQQPQPVIKSALKKKTNEPKHSDRIESDMTNASNNNNKAVHFNVTEATKDNAKKAQSLENTGSTTPSSNRRNEVSSGPSPSRLDYSLLSTTPTHPITDNKAATAVTPSTSGNSRHVKENQITRSQLRLSAVRAHGGRMGLQEKLRHVRRKHNVDEATSMFSPPQERKNPSIGFTSIGINSTSELKPAENKIVVSSDSTKSTANVYKSFSGTKAKETPAELETYCMKLERMRIRPRQVGK
jgi:hypothetical protein